MAGYEANFILFYVIRKIIQEKKVFYWTECIQLADSVWKILV